MRRVVLTALAVLAAVDASAHAGSVSYADFQVDDRAVRGVVRLPLDDVDLLLRLDRDLDGRVSQAEVDAAAPALSGYIAKHLHVAVDGTPLETVVRHARVWRDSSSFQYLEADVFLAASRIPDISIRTDFLTELYPSHQTVGRITARGREERFTFRSGAAYERRLGSGRAAGGALVVAAVVVLAILALVRGRRAERVAIAMMLAAAAPARADVIMSAPQLNTALKTMEKLKRQTDAAEARDREDAWFQLGAEADALASIMNLEVESHGMQERELLDLALGRTKELGIAIAYNRDKKKFFYDGAAFVEYLKAAPRGAHAAAAEFKLLSYQFYLSKGDDAVALAGAADAKKRFLTRYPAFEGNAELSLYLAVDYRDLSRLHAGAHDAANAAKYRQFAAAECRRIERQYRGTEQADAARQLLRGLQ